MQWQYFTAGFDRFIFDYNEGMHHLGLLADDKYITGSAFIAGPIVTVILFIAFDILVLSHHKYQRYLRYIFKNARQVGVYIYTFAVIIFFLYLVYMGAFILLSIVMTILIVLIKIYTDDKYIWLREKIDEFF